MGREVIHKQRGATTATVNIFWGVEDPKSEPLMCGSHGRRVSAGMALSDLGLLVLLRGKPTTAEAAVAASGPDYNALTSGADRIGRPMTSILLRARQKSTRL